MVTLECPAIPVSLPEGFCAPPPPTPPRPPHPPQAPSPPASPKSSTIEFDIMIILSSVLVTSAIGLAVLFYSRRRRGNAHRMLELPSLSSRQSMDVRIDGNTEPIDLRSYLLETLRSLGVAPKEDLATMEGHAGSTICSPPTAGHPPSPNAGHPSPHVSSRFQCTIDSLIMGAPKDAALGVVHLMKASPATVRAGMLRGVHEISAEFDAFCETVAHAHVGESGTLPWWVSIELAEEARECCNYCLHEAAGSSDQVYPNSPYGRDRDASGIRSDRLLPSGEGMRLKDFCALPEALTAQLVLEHVATLRIYTTAAFKVFNGPLREPWGERQHPFPVTISFLSEAIGKLRAVGAMEPGATVERDLWRGMRDTSVSDSFLIQGGTEQAPMSTTSSLAVALTYADDCKESLLFKLRTDSFMGRGASLRLISAFPAEDEFIYPPLTFLRPSTRQPEVIECEEGRIVTVVEVVPHLGSM
jgi:hypothetical protein